MACFLVPMTIGIITMALRNRFPKEWHVEWLNMMILGSTAMLAVEHVAHQEIVPYAPFLTAMGNPADTAVMLQEMATVGGAMTICILAVWVIMVSISVKVIGKAKHVAGQ